MTTGTECDARAGSATRDRLLFKPKLQIFKPVHRFWAAQCWAQTLAAKFQSSALALTVTLSIYTEANQSVNR